MSRIYKKSLFDCFYFDLTDFRFVFIMLQWQKMFLKLKIFFLAFSQINAFDLNYRVCRHQLYTTIPLGGGGCGINLQKSVKTSKLLSVFQHHVSESLFSFLLRARSDSLVSLLIRTNACPISCFVAVIKFPCIIHASAFTYRAAAKVHRPPVSDISGFGTDALLIDF